MKVILQQDIRGTGKKGQLIEVSDGYARNYLFPRKLAAPADNANMNEYRQKEASKAFHKQQELEAAQALAQKLEGITVKVTASDLLLIPKYNGSVDYQYAHTVTPDGEGGGA